MSWLRLEPFTATQTEKKGRVFLCKHMSWLRLEPFTVTQTEKERTSFSM